MTDRSTALAARMRPRPAPAPGRRVDLTVVLAEPALPVLRLLPAPVSEPPYDDEPSIVPALRLVPTAPAGRTPGRPPAPAPEDEQPKLRTRSGDLPPARPFAVALVHRLLEVRGGVRPVPQLQRDTTPGLYADLERGLRRRPRTGGSRPSTRDVHSVHVQQRPDGVAEVCATVRSGDRTGALALRLEGVDGRWLCTQLQGL